MAHYNGYISSKKAREIMDAQENELARLRAEAEDRRSERDAAKEERNKEWQKWEKVSLENHRLRARVAELEAKQLKPGEVRAKRIKCWTCQDDDKLGETMGDRGCPRCGNKPRWLVEVKE